MRLASIHRHKVHTFAELDELALIRLTLQPLVRRRPVDSNLKAANEKARVVDEPRVNRVVSWQHMFIIVLQLIVERSHLATELDGGVLDNAV